MSIISPLINNEALSPLFHAVAAGKNAALFGGGQIQNAAVAAALAQNNNTRLLVVTETDALAAKTKTDLETLFGGGAVWFPSREFVFIELESASRELEAQRLSALGKILSGEARIVVCSLAALCGAVMPRAAYKNGSFSVREGDKLDTQQLAGSLVAAGYTRTATVDGPGQFSIRGGIFDIFPPEYDLPLRVDLWGDDVDSISWFDPETQRRADRAGQVHISPARELVAASLPGAIEKLEQYAKSLKSDALREIVLRDLDLLRADVSPAVGDRYLPLLFDQLETILDYLPEAPVFLCEPGALLERHKQQRQIIEDNLKDLRERGLFEGKYEQFYRPFALDFGARPMVLCEAFTRSMPDVALGEVVTLGGTGLAPLAGDMAATAQEIKAYCHNNYAVVVLAGTQKYARSMAYDLEAAGIESFLLSDAPPRPGAVAVGEGWVSGGLEIPAARYALLTTRHRDKKKIKIPKKKKNAAFGSLEDMHVGDYVVHIGHGIGVFDGIHRIDHHGFVRDYIKIKYRGEDILYVPVTQLDMVSPYVAPRESENVKLAKLHSGDWAKTKKQVYHAAREMAKELIELYARREKEPGFAFSADSDWQSDFEARFPYDETEDQLAAIRDVKRDMQKPNPMDRLLCGDVGVGKTEVALRAAFKCVLDSKQCAVLVPTTILAWQHYSTFRERFESFPVKVVMLSRFSTAKEVKEAIAGIKDGTVDIVIGTHKLLQKDVQFKDLGLLVVDEEQRFGVAHKEKLKEAFAGIDVLTLSATPIPRTLNMAMTGIRDISVIEQPPEDRQPIQTYVLEYDEKTVYDAINRELMRGGQVYYLHNHVDTIERVSHRLREWFPDAEIEVAHGRMNEQQLSGIWRRVMNGECDILVCTTIIETGVDVSNCNTLIVENADRLGLAQLYQIRGRVGRSARRAYAYFTFRRDMVVSEIAGKRLSAIRDFTSFGSGFKIAMRDLQIRGAGGVLSARQSGHMESVGYETYVKILNEAVNDELGIPSEKPPVECVVDLKVDAYISERYIADNESRIDMYKKIAAIQTNEDFEEVTDELYDRFGELPPAVASLCSVSLLRALASNLGFYEITSGNGNVLLYNDNIDDEGVKRAVGKGKWRVMVSRKGKSYISVDVGPGGQPERIVAGVLEAYAG